MRIATRGSALALAQARWVADRLDGEHELVEVVTAGDRRRDVSDKREWVSEIEDALARGDADLAVHSAKDVPVGLPGGFCLAGVPQRAAAHDALCGASSLGALGEGARVGTSSVRRAAALRALRPDLEVAQLRGNVDTRLGRLAAGDYDAIVIALAGLQRLGRSDEAGCVLEEVVPAPAQGALILECLTDHAEARAAAARVTDDEALRCVTAERALVRALGADCHTPVGAHANQLDDRRLRLRAFAGKVDGTAWITDELEGGDAEALGAEIASRMLAAGADEVLGR